MKTNVIRQIAYIYDSCTGELLLASLPNNILCARTMTQNVVIARYIKTLRQPKKCLIRAYAKQRKQEIYFKTLTGERICLSQEQSVSVVNVHIVTI